MDTFIWTIMYIMYIICISDAHIYTVTMYLCMSRHGVKQSSSSTEFSTTEQHLRHGQASPAPPHAAALRAACAARAPLFVAAGSSLLLAVARKAFFCSTSMAAAPSLPSRFPPPRASLRVELPPLRGATRRSSCGRAARRAGTGSLPRLRQPKGYDLPASLRQRDAALAPAAHAGTKREEQRRCLLLMW